MSIAGVGNMANTDQELAERHRYGDPEAFEEIYSRFGTMVYSLALRMTGKPEDAADLCQDIFLKIYRHLGSFRGRSSLRTWVYRVAMNCCHSRFRRQRSWRSRLLADSVEVLQRVADESRSPEEEAVAQSTVQLVSDALTRLPGVYRQAVVLRDIEGLSYEEIAEVLGIRVGTVRSRIARGRDRLRALLEETR